MNTTTPVTHGAVGSRELLRQALSEREPRLGRGCRLSWPVRAARHPAAIRHQRRSSVIRPQIVMRRIRRRHVVIDRRGVTASDLGERPLRTRAEAVGLQRVASALQGAGKYRAPVRFTAMQLDCALPLGGPEFTGSRRHDIDPA